MRSPGAAADPLATTALERCSVPLGQRSLVCRLRLEMRHPKSRDPPLRATERGAGPIWRTIGT